MPVAKTVTGKPFEYSGSLATGLTVFFKPPHKKRIPVKESSTSFARRSRSAVRS